jgi:hypothetical protein
MAMVKRYWAAAANDIETNPCLVEGWVPVHLSSDYDALAAELAAMTEAHASAIEACGRMSITIAKFDFDVCPKMADRIATLEAAIRKTINHYHDGGKWFSNTMAELAATAETKVEPPAFTGWVSSACQHCGKLIGDHNPENGACYESDRGAAK